jgi:hypothetical protein
VARDVTEEGLNSLISDISKFTNKSFQCWFEF